jgi:hypothetical protein
MDEAEARVEEVGLEAGAETEDALADATDAVGALGSLYAVLNAGMLLAATIGLVGGVRTHLGPLSHFVCGNGESLAERPRTLYWRTRRSL